MKTVDFLFSKIVFFSNLLAPISILLLCSFGLRTILVLAGQTWVRTFAHTSTLTILPIITFVITKVISGDIALSLGMVGALSIVRFRNPVRSPLELSVYFLAITMGISASVSLNWLVALVLAIVVAFGLLSFGSLVAKNFRNENFFSASFSEGQDLPTLDVTSELRIERLERSDHLIAKVKTEQNYKYILASNKPENLQKLANEIDDQESVIRYSLKL